MKSVTFTCAITALILLTTGISSNVEAQREVTKRTKDFASVRIGPLKVNHKDGKYDPEKPDRVSYPGIFGGNHHITVGRRDAGFGGSVADLVLRIPVAGGFFDQLFDRQKGGFRIINHLYTKEDNPDEIPPRGAFLGIDYWKVTKKNKRTTAELKRRPNFSTWAKGSASFTRISRKTKRFKDSFGRDRITITVSVLFTVKGKVKDLIVRTTSPKFTGTKINVKKNARLSGRFLITLEKTITLLHSS